MILEWKNLACRFGDRTVFRGFSGTLAEGERVRVMAPSGCGKTSFLMMALKLLAPAEGSLALDGKAYAGLSFAHLRRAIAAVPQEAELADEPTVRGVIEAPFGYRLNRGVRPSEAAVRAGLAAFALDPSILDRDPASLSGGEKQRIACLVALLLPRRVLLLDEPFSALDPDSARAVARAFADSGRAILYVTHVDLVPSFPTRTIDLEACHVR